MAGHKHPVSSRKRCRDCGKTMKDATATSLRSGRCRPCHNDWFAAYVARKAERGSLTGRRARRNQPNFKKLLAWPAPHASPRETA